MATITRPAAQELALILPYVPQHIAQEVMRDPTAARPGGKAVEGTLLIADISGFTPMSERLAQTGREGAEELTLIMTTCFTRLVNVIASYGGIPLKFGGDSVLALFLGRRHPQRAVRCGLVAQQAIRSFWRIGTSVGYFPLRMSVGINTGRFLEVIAGLPSDRLHYLMVGSAVNETAKLETVASAGEVVAGPATVAALGSAAQVATAGQGAYRVVRLSAPIRRIPPAASGPEPPSDISVLAEALRAYLPRQVLEKARAKAGSPVLQGEHRLATVMFVNFKWAERPVSRKSPDGMAETFRLLDSYLAIVQRTVSRFGGEVLANDVGPGEHKLVVAFGALLAHEDDEERAALAALQIRDEVGQLGIPVSQRVGISSGHVFAGDVGSPTRRDFTVMGDEVNLAARLATAAEWGQILISERTYRKIAQRFDLEALPPMPIKGKRGSVSVYALARQRKRDAAARLRPGASGAPLLARDEEVRALERIMSLVLSGRGQVVEICGAPGIGKSRLVDEVLQLWAQRGGKSYVGQCQSFGENTAFLPWRALLRSLLGVQPEQPRGLVEDKISEAVSRLRPGLQDVAGTLGDVLGFPTGESAIAKALEPQRRMQRLMDVTAEVIRDKARGRALLFVMEDMHWADSASRDLVDHIAGRIKDVPVFLCLTQRSTERCPLAIEGMPHYTALLLEQLPAQESVELARLAIGAEALPQELADVVVLKSRGNPFYIEQMMRSLAGAGRVRRDDRTGRTVLAGDALTVEVPDSVEGMIMSRLDNLDETSRTVLQVASVAGMWFQQAMVEYVLGQSAMTQEVGGCLGRIEQAGLIRAERSDPGPEYAFDHGLLQQVVYESVPFTTRRELHQRAGVYLEENYAGTLDDYLELLSFHYSNSTDKRRAFLYATKAAEKCAKMFANREAVEHYCRALGVVESLPREVVAHACRAYAGLSDIYVLTGRYDEAIANCRAGLERQRRCPQARSLEERRSRATSLGHLCHTMGVAHERKGQYRRALWWYERGIASLEGRDTHLEATMCLAMAGVLLREGRYAEALERCTRGVDLARNARCRSELAHGYYLLGYISTDTGRVEEAIGYCRRALRIYRRMGDLLGQAKALNNLGAGRHYLGEWRASARCYQASLSLCEQAGDVTEAAVVANNLGEILSDQGDLEEASQLFSRSLSTWEAIGYKLGAALACSNLGRVATRQGRCAEAVELLQIGATTFKEIGSKGFLAEANVRLAEAYLQMGELGMVLPHARRALALGLAARAPLVEAASRRVLGQLCILRRRWSEGEQFLLESREINERAGNCYELGQTLYQLAVLYHQAPEGLLPNARANAEEAVAAALAIFRRLRVMGDLARTNSLARSLRRDEDLRGLVA